MSLHNRLLLASTLERPSVKVCLKAKRVYYFFSSFLSEYFDDCLRVTEECTLFEDEPQRSDQTFTLLARCCVRQSVELRFCLVDVARLICAAEQCVDIERVPIIVLKCYRTFCDVGLITGCNIVLL